MAGKDDEHVRSSSAAHAVDAIENERRWPIQRVDGDIVGTLRGSGTGAEMALQLHATEPIEATPRPALERALREALRALFDEAALQSVCTEVAPADTVLRELLLDLGYVPETDGVTDASPELLRITRAAFQSPASWVAPARD